MPGKLRIYTAITFAMIFWSVSFIWTRIAIESFLPVTLITLRLVIASVLLYSVSRLSGKFQRIRKEDRKWFILLAFFEPFLYYIGETYGLTMVDSTLASVIIATIPLFAPLVAYITLKEKPVWTNMLGIIVSLAGVFLVIYQPGSGFNVNPLGVALIFFAVLSSVAYTIILRKISTYYSTLNVIFYQSLIGLAFFIPTFLITDLKHWGEKSVTTDAIGALFMLSVFASVVAFVLFAFVVRSIGVAKSNVFVNLIPVFTAIFAKFILNENLTLIKMIGIAIVVGGLFVSQLGKMKINFKRIRGVEY
jgi:drug/metabolite transporter (DMT)-like permease